MIQSFKRLQLMHLSTKTKCIDFGKFNKLFVSLDNSPEEITKGTFVF